jgi:endoglucanase
MAALLSWATAPLATVAALLLPLGSADPAQAIPPRYYGVNLASAEFAPEKVPGIPGQDYIYPTAATAAPFRAMGMNSIRLPVLWERLQPRPNAPLDPAELARLDASLAGLAGFQQVIIDVHNYARYHGRLLSRDDGSGAQLADLWTRLAERYKGRPQITFGIMNEPHGIDAGEWRAIAEATVAAIRRTGARNLVLVPGTRWSGGHSWHVGGNDSNATALASFNDPGRNFAFDIHQYLDSDSSGSHSCSGTKLARARLAGVTQWLRQQNARAVLGEFGGDATPTCLAAIDDLLGYMRANGDVWIGWNYWAAGDWWGDYPYSLQPAGGKDKPQAAVLRRYIQSYRTP